ncbi:MAG: zinc ribbon domain-containing protein [Acidobacteriota bacterium]
MESPECWDLLTSSLAVCDLQKPAAVWAFLTLQGLISDRASDRIAFFKIVEKVRSQSPSTGSSRAYRIARRLRTRKIALPASETSDPHAKIALARRQLMDIWVKANMPEPTNTSANSAEGLRITTSPSSALELKLPAQTATVEFQEFHSLKHRTPENYCSRCGNDNLANAVFCKHCGIRLNRLEAPLPASEKKPGWFNLLDTVREMKITKVLSGKTHRL